MDATKAELGQIKLDNSKWADSKFTAFPLTFPLPSHCLSTGLSTGLSWAFPGPFLGLSWAFP